MHILRDPVKGDIPWTGAFTGLFTAVSLVSVSFNVLIFEKFGSIFMFMSINSVVCLLIIAETPRSEDS
jgi:hypothetical protein